MPWEAHIGAAFAAKTQGFAEAAAAEAGDGPELGGGPGARRRGNRGAAAAGGRDGSCDSWAKTAPKRGSEAAGSGGITLSTLKGTSL